MSDGGIIYGKQAHEQIAKTVREHTRRMMNQHPIRQRWQGANFTPETTRMYGRIVGADPDNLKAYVFIMGWNSDVSISAVPGNLGIPGMPINVVEVCDPTGCGGLARPYAELVRPDDLDVYCWADYMRGTPEPVCRPGYETPDRLWIVDKVCCSLDSCNGG